MENVKHLVWPALAQAFYISAPIKKVRNSRQAPTAYDNNTFMKVWLAQ